MLFEGGWSDTYPYSLACVRFAFEFEGMGFWPTWTAGVLLAGQQAFFLLDAASLFFLKDWR
jgi:hypothetical protein